MGQDKYLWTNHSKMKMRHYRLTESRIKRVIRHPARTEEGILPRAIAAMSPAEGKRYSEIWVMYVLTRKGGLDGNTFLRHDSAASSGGLAKGRRDFPFSAEPSKSRLPLSRKRIAVTAPFLAGGLSTKIKVITAWRYPGHAPERDPVPLEILREIRALL